MIVWLAKFHADFFETDVSGLWPAGSYWDLQRPHRLSAMKDIEAESDLERDLITFASDFDSEIKKCSFQTIIHGDAKVENFCFSENGEVAGLDFQWVGKGTGLRDLMCLISSCVKSEKLIQESLDFYFSSSSDHLSKTDNFEGIEREWRQIWLGPL